MDLRISVSHFKGELVPTIEQAVKAAVDVVVCELAKLIDSKLVDFQIEMEKENARLKMRLEMSDNEVNVMRGYLKTAGISLLNSNCNKQTSRKNNSEIFALPGRGSGNITADSCVPLFNDKVNTAVGESSIGFTRCPSTAKRDCISNPVPSIEIRDPVHAINRDCRAKQQDIAQSEQELLIRVHDYEPVSDTWIPEWGRTVKGTEDETCLPDTENKAKTESVQIIEVTVGGKHTELVSEVEPGCIKQEALEQQSGSEETCCIIEEGTDLGSILGRPHSTRLHTSTGNCRSTPALADSPVELSHRNEGERRMPSTSRTALDTKEQHGSCILSHHNLSYKQQQGMQVGKTHQEEYWQSMRTETVRFQNSSLPQLDLPFVKGTTQQMCSLETPETSSGKKSSQLENLSRHLGTQAGKRWFCNVCRKSFHHLVAYRQHQRVHMRETPHRCNECGISFARVENLKVHQQIHTGGKLYHCIECGQSFSLFETYKQHQRVHTGETNRCSVCGKSFSRSANLKRHQLIHTGEKPFRCTQCGQMFRHSGAFKRHQRLHT
ncbi:UNVERIFIED_CONTAM: hypothetical protein FKN15_044372 [Acipenser sinensis]